MIHWLWNEGEIWSKKVDLIREIAREIRDRRIEESVALQSPIDQFLADSRQIRLQLQQSFARGKATAERLEQISGQFRQVGLLDENELVKVQNAASGATKQIDQVDAQLRSINKSESDMQEVPKGVFVDRIIPPAPDQKLIEEDAGEGLLPFKKLVEFKGTHTWVNS
jgi:valyl-tRNA synthetase